MKNLRTLVILLLAFGSIALFPKQSVINNKEKNNSTSPQIKNEKLLPKNETQLNVISINKSYFVKGVPTDSISKRWQMLLNLTCREIFSNWWGSSQSANHEGEYVDFGYLENNTKTGEHGKESKGGIRTPSENAYTIAAAVFTGVYDSSIVGVSKSTAILRAVTIIKSLAKDHKANGGIGIPWGDHWQSSQWSSKCSIAGWLLWDYLEKTDREYVSKMIEYEANRFLKIKAPSANDNYKVNTRGEENGWDASGIQAACAMMPLHKNFKEWTNSAISYRVNALATPLDLNNKNEIDGRPVMDWISGYNIDTLGALGNHNLYPHPDYMASPLRHTIEGVIFLALAHQHIPAANRFHCNLIYKNFVDYNWGNNGTIYDRSGTINWPVDREADRRFLYLTFGIIDAGALILKYDELASIKASYWEEKHTKEALNTKRTAFTSASAYLLHWLAFQGADFVSNE